MDARAIIVKIRDHQSVTQEELNWFAQGLADRGVSDAQAGAFAMAALLNGLGEKGRVGLTLAMRDSGDVMRWDMDRPVLDKHSTGGVGDCVSLILAPALAVCGAYVPMISGRGLGHTGGTLDKLEAIPGYRTDLDEAQFRKVVGQVGCAIVSASGDIAPADKRLYAVRDISGTVESLDLITASILSKKLAAGLEGLVLDVKVGTGAFMKSAEDARALAQALVNTANAAGCQTSALITDMNQPLAPELGNALEVASSMRVLTRQVQGRLLDLTAQLGGVALANAGLAGDAEAGAEQIAKVIADGSAADCFGRMVAAQGGPVQFVENWQRFLPEAPVIRELVAPTDGYIVAMDGQALGLAVVGLGGGRQVESDVVDPAVGISDMLPLGTKVQKGQPVARVHAAREEAADVACKTVLGAVTLSSKAPDLPPLIHERIG
ncbi:Thymidine phosphorylase [Thalassovita gelatinovora]|uniref:Thymidine phosphorylase n=1 Tax=Thalassovita gelatinovora TaxID=53501 RepID=A0A0P1F7J1_THAGE|nr:thymidine phosphorylase [Thalassovita gelatinovora]QIZ80182.1 thymidine phosphorylase [Thalassovita gelatinovora]CUH63998.1 Thymidine phosphorylase [Thalassovita gelatinovora]SEQ81326.1 thymidine phosphorylase [Thalassovita gelatinovora]